MTARGYCCYYYLEHCGKTNHIAIKGVINSLRIKQKAQNFASWMFSEYTFKIGRKEGNDFLIIVPH